MKTKTALTLAVFATAASPAFADEWYEGGTLNDKDNVAWQEADEGNRLASAADTVAALWMADKLSPQVRADIPDVDAIRPYAEELVTCIDSASAGDSGGVRISYPDMALGCVVLMGWTAG